MSFTVYWRHVGKGRIGRISDRDSLWNKSLTEPQSCGNSQKKCFWKLPSSITISIWAHRLLIHPYIFIYKWWTACTCISLSYYIHTQKYNFYNNAKNIERISNIFFLYSNGFSCPPQPQGCVYALLSDLAFQGTCAVWDRNLSAHFFRPPWAETAQPPSIISLSCLTGQTIVFM